MDKNPKPDIAEDNAFFPSPYSLSQYTSARTDFDGADYPAPYKGTQRILMIGTDERYIQMKNGAFFSTGNHPVEMLLPMHHLDKAGFAIDVATLSGNPVKLELWAMPREDAAVKETYEKYSAQLKAPLKLSEVLESSLGVDSPYAAVFIPGGHGVLARIPRSTEVKQVLSWAMENNKFIITLCHGPSCLLAAAVHEDGGEFDKAGYIFSGYELCVFPDALDEGPNIDIGYMPGKLPWLIGENLQKLGVKILNEGITGQCHRDRKLITGDSPLASNRLGKMAAQALLEELAK